MTLTNKLIIAFHTDNEIFHLDSYKNMLKGFFWSQYETTTKSGILFDTLITDLNYNNLLLLVPLIKKYKNLLLFKITNNNDIVRIYNVNSSEKVGTLTLDNYQSHIKTSYFLDEKSNCFYVNNTSILNPNTMKH